MNWFQRWCWRIYDVALHPRRNLQDWLKWHNRPKIGSAVEDCRGQIHKVVAFGDTADDLILDDGSHASWMHCCDYPTEKEVEEEAGDDC